MTWSLWLTVRKGQLLIMDRLRRTVGTDRPLLLVVLRRADHPGHRRLDDRKVLCGILFVLYNRNDVTQLTPLIAAVPPVRAPATFGGGLRRLRL